MPSDPLTPERLALLRLHLAGRCTSAPAETAEVFAEIARLQDERLAALTANGEMAQLWADDQDRIARLTRRVTYLERQSAGRLEILEDTATTKRFLEEECSRLRSTLAYLRRRCLNGAGTVCRLCAGGWIAEEGETADDHHVGCPLGVLLSGDR